MVTGGVLLFFATATVTFSLLPTAVAQPGNKAVTGSNITGEEDLAADQLVNCSTVAQEGSPEAHPTACIRSLADLRQAYLDFKTAPGSWPKDSTIFSFHPTDAVKYTSLAIFYDISTEKDGDQPTPSSLNSTGCCNPENTSSCVVFLRHHSHLYITIYPSLIYLYAFPLTPSQVGWFGKFINRFGVQKLCWKVPPFCIPSKMLGGQSGNLLLRAFTAEVIANTCTHTVPTPDIHSVYTLQA